MKVFICLFVYFSISYFMGYKILKKFGTKRQTFKKKKPEVIYGMKNKKHIMAGFIQSREVKSRRDGILLTVDFNLRTINAAHTTQSPAGTVLYLPIVLSLRDCWMSASYRFLRRLKSTINKVLSLRDSSLLIKDCYKFFIFHS